MKTFWRFLMGLMFMLMALAGVAQAQEETAVPEDVIEVEAGAINFQVPAGLAAEIEVVEVEEVPFEDGMPYFAANPAYVRVDLLEFGGETDLIFPATLSIIPTADLAAFGEEDYTLLGRTNNLTAFLEDQPELESGAMVMTENGVPLPFTTILNAAQVFYAQPEYIDFEGGSGIRYLTYYSQAVDPIVEGWVFYTFQGITDDGEHIISAIFPVDTGLLPEPDEMDYETFNYDAFAANYETYLSDLVMALSERPAEDFSPALETLDAIVKSITVVEA